MILDALIRMELEAAKGHYPTVDLAAVFTEGELAYLDRHNAITASIQIRHINNAIYLARHPEAWWTGCYEDVLKKSYEWCEFFGIYATPRAAHATQACSRR